MADEFSYVEGATSVKDIVKNLVTEITQNATAIYKWTLVSPTTVADITNYAVVSTKNLYCDKVFYTRFERSAATTPTSAQQAVVDKYNNSKPYTDEQIALLKRYMGSLDLGKFVYSEVNLIKKDPTTLSEDEQTLLQFVIDVRALTDYEVQLARKYLLGQSMTTDEENQYQVLKELHTLTAEEVVKITELKKDKKITSDYIITIILKEAMGFISTAGEQSSLASYRQSLELTDKEMQQISLILGSLDNRNHLEITVGTEIEDKQIMQKQEDGTQVQVTIKSLVDTKCSLPARFSWYSILDDNIGDWLPVQYWITQNKDSVNIVLRGDPSVDNHPYQNYLTSWAYIGAVKPVQDAAYTDDIYNFGHCTSSDLEPNYIPKFGRRTGTGVTDFTMVGNKIGAPYQPHYSAFYCTTQFIDKKDFQGSRWNMNKHTFDNITIVHPVDMERGILQNVMVGDASALNDTDRLVYEKDGVKEWYRKFKINAPYSLFTNSPNQFYCIAIRIYSDLTD
ncbi:hypothetical protein [Clostridium scatologenes]|uniref:Uncharacterized protein n=1 Tax=Clostridium scatologenes TaxID=1548 RepID=A0A0E3K1I5_CLOSL|nr:hypothetical protein [Clostridium scatologenes]AKA70124.1 hypothetical protein CSCA_2999 [Clostridium scatologenes]